MSLRTASYSMSPELGKPHEVALHHPAIRRAVLEGAAISALVAWRLPRVNSRSQQQPDHLGIAMKSGQWTASQRSTPPTCALHSPICGS
jgi:hypothetical protein